MPSSLNLVIYYPSNNTVYTKVEGEQIEEPQRKSITYIIVDSPYIDCL